VPWAKDDFLAAIQQKADYNDPAMPLVRRVDIKLEDVYRSDLPGCARHPTAGAIVQHSYHIDPQTSLPVDRFTGMALCAECEALVQYIDHRN
jgi:hypothetical protein